MIYIAYIMSVYRGDNPDWFSLAIQSVIDQNLPLGYSARIYLAIDGPISQELEEVIYRKQHCIYKIIKSDLNLGLSNALNLCIKNLEDERYVFRMDADDISLKNRTFLQLTFMESNPDIGICGGSIEEFSGDEPTSIRKFYPLHCDIKNNMHKGTAVAHVTVCFRRETLDFLNGYSLDYPFNEDIELWFRALLQGVRFANLGDTLVKVRIGSCFFKRRSVTKAKFEFFVYWNGCTKLYGFSLKNVFVLLRLIFRLFPSSVVRYFYKSRVRSIIFRC